MGWLRTAAPPVVYHGTSSEPFVVFERTDDIGFHFSEDPEAADARLNSERLVGPGDTEYGEGARIMPVRLLVSNPLRLPDLHTWDPDKVLYALRDAGVLSEDEVEGAFDSGALVDRQFVAAALAGKGYDSIVYRNETEYKGGEENQSDSYIVFDPRRIKSVFNQRPDRRRKDITSSGWLRGAAGGSIRFSELREEEQDNVAVAVYNTHFLERDGEEGTPSKDDVLAWLRGQDAELRTGTVRVDDLIAQIADEHWGTHAEKSAPLLEALESGEELDPILLDGDRLVDGAHRTMAAHEHGLEELPSVDIGPLLKTKPEIGKGAEGAKKEPKAEPHSMDVDPGWGSAYGKVAGLRAIALGFDGRTLAIDFDGTLAQLTPDKSAGEPIPGAIEALEALRQQGYTVLIWSNRTKTPGGEEEVRVWLDEHGAPFDGIISGEKPSHVLFVDNQAVKFSGDWETTLREIVELEAAESANPAEVANTVPSEIRKGWLRR